MDPCYISITLLASRVEISKYIFAILYHSIFTGFTIHISCFQVFYIFFILSFLYIFWFYLAFTFSRFTFALHYEVFYFLFILFFIYIFVSLQVFYIFHVLKFYYIFLTLELSLFFFFFLLLSFSYVLYFKFPAPLAKSLWSRKCFIYWFVLQSQQMFFISVMLKD